MIEQNSFNLSQSTSSNRTVEYFTGLTAVSVVGVNPTHEELKVITGNDNIPASFCDYKQRENQFLKIQEFPITVWFKVGNATFPQTINVGKESVSSRNGKVKFINNYGKISSFIGSLDDIKNNPKMAWFSTSVTKPVLVGEEILYSLMKQLYRYDETSDGWLDNMVSNNITADKLVDGVGIKELRNFFNLCKDNQLVMLLTVKKRLTSDGKERLQQEVVMNPDLMFRTVTGQVTDSMLEKVKQLDADYLLRVGKPISNNEYSYEFGPYSENNVVNKTPKNIVSSGVDDFLNFV